MSVHRPGNGAAEAAAQAAAHAAAHAELATSDVDERGSGRATLPNVGDQLRARRTELGLSVRELARRIAVSASLISQIETRKATPSVATLYAITTELGLSLDELFLDQPLDGQAPSAPDVRPVSASPQRADTQRSDIDRHATIAGPEVTRDQRKAIQLDSGVRWERLTPGADPHVEFLFLRYEPGAASCEANSLMRHNGHEYGYVLSGTLLVTIGFEDHVLHPGDSISFTSTTPHRLATIGSEPVEAIWFVVGRSGPTQPS